MTTTVAASIESYLRTGRTEAHREAWPGGFPERANASSLALRAALVREVTRLAAGRAQRPMPDLDVVALTRGKVEPMVRGLFPRAEQAAVLRVLEHSVVFVTAQNIERLLLDQAWDHSAWNIGNLYLTSLGADMLGASAPDLVGISEETNCFVSPEYFAGDEPFADFIVHEAAHVFHNSKRSTVGLVETRRSEWLLDIEFGKRETFAHACEVYSRILDTGASRSDRLQLAVDFIEASPISDSRVDPGELAEIVREAAAARNGWKIILTRCSPVRR